MASRKAKKSDVSSERIRGWCFTMNNYTDKHQEELRALDCVYMVFGREVAPTTGTPHLQGYVYLKDGKSMSAFLKLLPRGINIRKAEGTADENYVYCSKDGDFEERGVRPKDPKDGGKKANLERWDSARRAAEEGRFSDIPSDIFMRTHGTCKRIRAETLLAARGNHDTTEKMLWFWGKAGTGKSRAAREHFPGAYFKMCNKWWDHYEGEKFVIIDDFDISHKVLIHHLKIWGDRYAFMAEIKGGSSLIRPDVIIVTSNYHPSEIWESESDLEPILRRYKCVEFPSDEYKTSATCSSASLGPPTAAVTTAFIPGLSDRLFSDD